MTSTINTAKGDITIRVATEQDATQIYNLRLEALQSNPEAFTADVKKTTEKGVKAWVTLIESYGKDQSGVIMIATCANGLIGMTGLVRGHWPKTRHRADLWGVYIKPAWRGIHLCEAIVRYNLEWAKDQQITAVMLGVNSLNVSAIQCYSRCGFSITGKEPRAMYDQGVYYDELIMVKLL
jgi:RimJ/RimL family protein N-acetyltransferase